MPSKLPPANLARLWSDKDRMQELTIGLPLPAHAGKQLHQRKMEISMAMTNLGVKPKKLFAVGAAYEKPIQMDSVTVALYDVLRLLNIIKATNVPSEEDEDW